MSDYITKRDKQKIAFQILKEYNAICRKFNDLYFHYTQDVFSTISQSPINETSEVYKEAKEYASRLKLRGEPLFKDISKFKSQLQNYRLGYEDALEPAFDHRLILHVNRLADHFMRADLYFKPIHNYHENVYTNDKITGNVKGFKDQCTKFNEDICEGPHGARLGELLSYWSSMPQADRIKYQMNFAQRAREYNRH